jgi:hypothetical protein
MLVHKPLQPFSATLFKRSQASLGQIRRRKLSNMTLLICSQRKNVIIAGAGQ